MRAANFPHLHITIWTMLILLSNFNLMSMETKAEAAVPLKSWKELGVGKTLSPANGAFYFEFPLENGSTAHLVVAYLKDHKWRLRPYLSEKTKTTSQAAAEQGASAAINGGFFNLSDGASTSYVFLDGKLSADPHDNKALLSNPKLQTFLPTIFNRSEIRILQAKSARKEETKIQFALHDEKLPDGYLLLDSLQAGPRLLPRLSGQEEAFIRKESDGSIADSISCRKPAARSAIGITADGYALILAVAGKGQDPESAGISLTALADLMRRLGCKEAINLDGGSSTSLYVKLKDDLAGRSVCAKDPETLVKSVLLLLPQ